MNGSKDTSEKDKCAGTNHFIEDVVTFCLKWFWNGWVYIFHFQ